MEDKLSLENLEEVEIDHSVEEELESFNRATHEDAYSLLDIGLEDVITIDPRSADELETLGLEGPVKFVATKEYFERTTIRAIKSKHYFEGKRLTIDRESSKDYLSPEPSTVVMIVVIGEDTLPVFVTPDTMKPTGYLTIDAIEGLARDFESLNEHWENITRPNLIVDGAPQPSDL